MFHPFGLYRKGLDLHRPLQCGLDFIQVVGFGEAGKRAFAEGSDPVLLGAVRRQHNHREVPIEFGQDLEDPQPVEIGQLEIEQDRRVVCGLHPFNGLRPRSGSPDLVALMLEGVAQGLTDVRVIIHDQDRRPRLVRNGRRAWFKWESV